jgi:hypothetical protein
MPPPSLWSSQQVRRRVVLGVERRFVAIPLVLVLARHMPVAHELFSEFGGRRRFAHYFSTP